MNYLTKSTFQSHQVKISHNTGISIFLILISIVIILTLMNVMFIYEYIFMYFCCRINIAPLVQNFAEKRHPSSSASQSEEKSKTKSVSSPAASSFHQLGKKTPTSQVQSLKKQRPKSRTSFR